ncbi:hypothetical protein X566_03235 [Afipia sp. P52-10]|nr:hypothetical protein X566_03235 [Afipia sp. P52-10]
MTPAPVAVTANGGTSVYGASPGNPGLSASGLQNGEGVDALTGLFNSFGVTATTGVAGGPYTLSVQGVLSNPNYHVASLNTGLWTVKPAPIAVTADTQSRLFSEIDPAFTYRITSGQLFNGDAFSGALARQPGSAIGVYAIGQGTLALSPNYALSFVGSSLEIKALPSDPSSQFSPPATGRVGRPDAVTGGQTSISFQLNPALPVSIDTNGSGEHSHRREEATEPAPTVTASIDAVPHGDAPVAGAAHGLVFAPISQYDPREYAAGVLPGFEARAGQAAVLTMIARAVARETDRAIFIDTFWNASEVDKASQVDAAPLAGRVMFADGAGKPVDPAVADALNPTAAVAVGERLQSAPVMLASAPDQHGTRAWMLALRLSDDGRGIVANDPATGKQVMLGYDSESGAIGGVTRVFNLRTRAWVALTDAEAMRVVGLDDLTAGVVTMLQDFRPAGYLTVVIP